MGSNVTPLSQSMWHTVPRSWQTPPTAVCVMAQVTSHWILHSDKILQSLYSNICHCFGHKSVTVKVPHFFARLIPTCTTSVLYPSLYNSHLLKQSKMTPWLSKCFSVKRNTSAVLINRLKILYAAAGEKFIPGPLIRREGQHEADAKWHDFLHIIPSMRADC